MSPRTNIELVMYRDDIKRLHVILKFLSPRERDVIERYFGINQQTHSDAAIGRCYNLTTSRIQQIRHGALKKLKRFYKQDPQPEPEPVIEVKHHPKPKRKRVRRCVSKERRPKAPIMTDEELRKIIEDNITIIYGRPPR